MKHGRRAVCLALSLLFVQAFSLPAKAVSTLQTEAQAVILMDAASGTVVYEQDADTPYDVAGMSKLMSMLVMAEALEDGTIRPEDTVTISKTAASTGGMSGFLEQGAAYTVEELFKAVAMISANDAAVALAEYICGSCESFVACMNERGKELGLSCTFTSPTGYKAQGQQLSARDCAVLAAELTRHPAVLACSSIYMDQLLHPGARETDLVNPNRLVRFYSGCDGLATGSGGSGGYCGAFTAIRGSSRYIAVVLGAQNADSRAAAAQKLLDHGFAHYESVVLVEKGKGLARDVPVENGRKKSVHGVAAEEVKMLLEKGAASQVEKEVTLYEELRAPVEEGQQIGEMRIMLSGREIARVGVVAYERVEEASVFNCARDIWLDWLRR